jgi:hypothetical protein
MHKENGMIGHFYPSMGIHLAGKTAFFTNGEESSDGIKTVSAWNPILLLIG